MSSSAVCATVFEATAKPTPELDHSPVAVVLSVAIWSARPITSPPPSSSGPPELPGLIEASVWMAPVIVASFGGGDGSSNRADDSGGDRPGQPERASDRNHAIAHVDR